MESVFFWRNIALVKKLGNSPFFQEGAGSEQWAPERWGRTQLRIAENCQLSAAGPLPLPEGSTISRCNQNDSNLLAYSSTLRPGPEQAASHNTENP